METKQSITKSSTSKEKTSGSRRAASEGGSTKPPKLSKRIKEIIARGDLHEVAIEMFNPKKVLTEEEIAALAEALSDRRAPRICKRYKAFQYICGEFEKEIYPFRVEFERAGNQLIGFYRFIKGLTRGKELAKELSEIYHDYIAVLEETLSPECEEKVKTIRQKIADVEAKIENNDTEEHYLEQIMIGAKSVKFAYSRFCDALKGFSLWLNEEKDLQNKEYRFMELIKSPFLERWLSIEKNGEDYAYYRMPELSKTYLAEQQKKQKKVLPELARTAVFPLYQELQPHMSEVEWWARVLDEAWQMKIK